MLGAIVAQLAAPHDNSKVPDLAARLRTKKECTGLSTRSDKPAWSAQWLADSLAAAEVQGSGPFRGGRIRSQNRRLGDDGAAALARKLPQDVRSLELGDSGVGAAGAAALAAALNRSGAPQLRLLNMSGNLLGNVGVSAIANGLTGAVALRTVDVRGNCVTDHGGLKLARRLPPGVTHLALGFNRIGHLKNKSCRAALSLRCVLHSERRTAFTPRVPCARADIGRRLATNCADGHHDRSRQ